MGDLKKKLFRLSMKAMKNEETEPFEKNIDEILDICPRIIVDIFKDIFSPTVSVTRFVERDRNYLIIVLVSYSSSFETGEYVNFRIFFEIPKENEKMKRYFNHISHKMNKNHITFHKKKDKRDTLELYYPYPVSIHFLLDNSKKIRIKRTSSYRKNSKFAIETYRNFCNMLMERLQEYFGYKEN